MFEALVSLMEIINFVMPYPHFWHAVLVFGMMSIPYMFFKTLGVLIVWVIEIYDGRKPGQPIVLNEDRRLTTLDQLIALDTADLHRPMNVWYADQWPARLMKKIGRFIPGFAMEACRVGQDTTTFVRVFFR